MQNLVTMAGGVAFNCVANGKILREGPFENLWIQPAAGDAGGGALGAATFVWHQLLDKPRDNGGARLPVRLAARPAVQTNEEIKRYLDSVGAVYHFHEDDEKLYDHIAELLATENVVGHVRADAWSSGRGPSARARSSATRARRRCSR